MWSLLLATERNNAVPFFFSPCFKSCVVRESSCVLSQLNGVCFLFFITNTIKSPQVKFRQLPGFSWSRAKLFALHYKWGSKDALVIPLLRSYLGHPKEGKKKKTVQGSADWSRVWLPLRRLANSFRGVSLCDEIAVISRVQVALRSNVYVKRYFLFLEFGVQLVLVFNETEITFGLSSFGTLRAHRKHSTVSPRECSTRLQVCILDEIKWNGDEMRRFHTVTRAPFLFFPVQRAVVLCSTDNSCLPDFPYPLPPNPLFLYFFLAPGRVHAEARTTQLSCKLNVQPTNGRHAKATQNAHASFGDTR